MVFVASVDMLAMAVSICLIYVGVYFLQRQALNLKTELFFPFAYALLTDVRPPGACNRSCGLYSLVRVPEGLL